MLHEFLLINIVFDNNNGSFDVNPMKMMEMLREFEEMKKQLLGEENNNENRIEFPYLDSKEKPIKCHENLEVLLSKNNKVYS